MKVNEFYAENNIKTDAEARNFFRNNMLQGKAPVAITVCPKCGEILDGLVPCPKCYPKKGDYIDITT